MFFGWLPDIPDTRDYSLDSKEIKDLLPKSKTTKRIDLRKYFPEVVDQGRLGSCTANAAAGLIGYYMNLQGPSEPVSRLFTYKTTRNLMESDGDTGAYIRTAMGSLSAVALLLPNTTSLRLMVALFGSPPEKYWQYDISKFDDEPPAFCYSFASNFQALKYFRLDYAKMSEKEILASIKETLTRKLPCMFGFSVYESINNSANGKIPFPKPKEKTLGGHAVCAVGYDDTMKIGSTVGAFVIRNSWGTAWGDSGYGYLPYEYVLQGVALDWWCLLKAEWIDIGQFGV